MFACFRSRREPAICTPTDVGWLMGTSVTTERPVKMWSPWDRTTGVLGQQGSGKTLDVLVPALLQAPGPALATMTKPQDMLLSLQARARRGPVVVMDPFGLAPGLEPLRWNPVAGCADPMVAERRGKAFSVIAAAGKNDSSATRFYANEATKVLAGFLHAAALAEKTMSDVLSWVTTTGGEQEPIQILQTVPMAAPHWDNLVYSALHGDPRTASNTRTTVHQAVAALLQPAMMERCVPTPHAPAVDIHDVIRNNGTFYFLGREDPYQSATPFMTAAVEAVLDAALDVAAESPHSRLCPSFFACLDELPSTAPIPTLITRIANERALGISIMWASQSLPQLRISLGDDEARALLALTNNLLVFGGSKDTDFNRMLSDMIGTVKYATRSHTVGFTYKSSQVSHTTEAIIRPEEIRRIDRGHVLYIAEGMQPVVMRVNRSIEGAAGKKLLAEAAQSKRAVDQARAAQRAPMPAREMITPPLS